MCLWNVFVAMYNLVTMKVTITCERNAGPENSLRSMLTSLDLHMTLLILKIISNLYLEVEHHPLKIVFFFFWSYRLSKFGNEWITV